MLFDTSSIMAQVQLYYAQFNNQLSEGNSTPKAVVEDLKAKNIKPFTPPNCICGQQLAMVKRTASEKFYRCPSHKALVKIRVYN